MDEGFNTFMDLENAALYFRGETYGDTIATHARRLYASHAVPGQEQPMITRPVESRDLFWTGYQKPALMLSVLRDEVLGREAFEAAFRGYLRAWAFRHPTPGDFFRFMRTHTGRDLAWFWRDWVYTTAPWEQVVESIAVTDSGSVVTVRNKGGMQLPVRLRLAYADGATEEVELPVEAWNLGSVVRYPSRRPVARAEVVAPVTRP
jgi:aminopeptidase N